jgi:hypothetical protein
MSAKLMSLHAGRSLSAFAVGMCALLASAGAAAQGVALSDGELSEVTGQALMSLNNTSLNGLDFTRITLGADIQLSANFKNIRFGEYTDAARNATGADIDIPLLQFGRSDGTAAQRTVSITDPYFEIVYRGAAGSPTREIVGMRFGFGGIAGDLGIKINTLSGSMRIDAGADGVVDSRTDTTGGGRRWDGSCAAPCLALSQVGGITAGDAGGASRDFWLSVQKSAVQFPTGGNGSLPDIAQPGFWLNWRDKLQGTNINLPPPPNLPPARGG